MDLTFDETLEKAIALHADGELQSAELLYRTLLEIQPDQPDANHKLGALALVDGDINEALERFVNAIQANPNVESYWVSYIDGLIEAKRFIEAGQTLTDVKHAGVTALALDELRQKLELAQIAMAAPSRGVTASPARDGPKPADYVDEPIAVSEKGPSHSQLTEVVEAFNAGRFAETEKLAKHLTKEFPHHEMGWKALGAALNQTGRLEEALVVMSKTVQLAPFDAEAHYNLGCALQEVSRWGEAELCFRKALEVAPDYAEAHCNLSAALQELGRFFDAEQSGRQAVLLDPDNAEAHCTLGNALAGQKKLDEAEVAYRRAVAIRFEFPAAHNNLGAVLEDLGRLKEAEQSYSRAIELKPQYEVALLNRSKVRFELGLLHAALEDADLCDSEESRARALDSLFGLGRFEEICERIDGFAHSDPHNIRVAAFSAFISQKLGKPTGHDFCPNPLSMIHSSNLASHLDDSEAFISELIGDLNDLEAVWEPAKQSTHNGFQLPININLFEQPSEAIQRLEAAIHDELDKYRLRFREEECALIKDWPAQKSLHGWHVVLKSQGYQDSHIHPSGWVSGVVYLKVVPGLDNSEGAVEFSLNGKNYSDVDSPSYTYQPLSGDIVLFPSSLHHRTIPFSTDSDRVAIAFDVIPTSREAAGDRENEVDTPSPERLSRALQFYQDRSFEEAEAAARLLTKEFPEHQFGWKVLGAVLQETKNFSESLKASRISLRLAPADPDAHNNLGNVFKATGKLADAEESYRQAIAFNPNYTEAHYNLGTTLKALNRLDEAEVSLKQALVLNPNHEHAKHVLAAISGVTTAAAPIEYVEKLFDSYADEFEFSLVDSLGYQIPKKIAEIIFRTNTDTSLGTVLDLGCGTGLFGAEVGANCLRLEGVDISGNMLQKARERGVYDKLVKNDIVSYLSTEPLDFNYILAADVFVYLGNLSEVFTSISNRNQLNSVLAFSVEHIEGSGFALQQSGRYAHSRQYIEELCSRHSCELVHFELQNLRMEKGVQLMGGIYLVSFPGKLKSAVHNHRSDSNLKKYIDKLLSLLQEGETQTAEKLARTVVQKYPSDVSGWNLLGVVLKLRGKARESLEALQKATCLAPQDAELHNNLGVTYRELGELSAAEDSYRRAIELKPDYAEAHINLGNTRWEFGDFPGAKESYTKAIEAHPDATSTHYRLGVLLYENHQYEEAAKEFELAGPPESVDYSLRCSYAIDDATTFFRKLDAAVEQHEINAVIGSLSNCAQIKYGTERHNPFCNAPLEYVRQINLSSEVDFQGIFCSPINRVLLEHNPTERYQGLLRNGIQTAGNIFSHKEIRDAGIEEILRREIEMYRTRFADSCEGFITGWPSTYELYGWLISMHSGGELLAHMHDDGWITGSVYVNVPPKSEPHSGNLVLCVGDEENSLGTNNIDERIIDVATGSLCLFPSSLRHYTVPFVSSETRVVLAFDVKPV